MKLFFILNLLLLSTIARADLIPQISITSDWFTDARYEIGFDVAPNHDIQQIYFQDSDGSKTFFTIDQLKDDYVTIFKVAGFRLVRLKLANMESPQSGTVELQILKNYIFKKRATIQFHVSLNEETQNYEIKDLRNGTVIHTVLQVTKVVAGVPMGVEDLVTK